MHGCGESRGSSEGWDWQAVMAIKAQIDAINQTGGAAARESTGGGMSHQDKEDIALLTCQKLSNGGSYRVPVKPDTWTLATRWVQWIVGIGVGLMAWMGVQMYSTVTEEQARQWQRIEQNSAKHAADMIAHDAKPGHATSTTMITRMQRDQDKLEEEVKRSNDKIAGEVAQNRTDIRDLLETMIQLREGQVTLAEKISNLTGEIKRIQPNKE